MPRGLKSHRVWGLCPGQLLLDVLIALFLLRLFELADLHEDGLGNGGWRLAGAAGAIAFPAGGFGYGFVVDEGIELLRRVLILLQRSHQIATRLIGIGMHPCALC